MNYKEKIVFHERYLEDSRKFMLTPLKAKYLYDHIGVSLDQHIIDVGCGTGFYTRIIANLVGEKGNVVGVDINDQLIEAATNFAKEDGIKNLNFNVDNALDLKFPNETFDVAVCHFFLSRLPFNEAELALSEMIRVTKKGGIVAAFEPCLGAMTALYYPEPRLTDLLNRVRRVKSLVQKELHNIDENIGGLLPEIFTRNGLNSISTEVFAIPWWTPPPMNERNIKESLNDWFTRRLEALAEPESKKVEETYGKMTDAAAGLRLSNNDPSKNDLVKIYETYGISQADLVELRELRVKYLEKIINGSIDPETYINDFELIPVFAITSRK